MTARHGRTVVVVGGAHDLGPAICAALTEPGTRIVVVDDPTSEREQIGVPADLVEVELDRPDRLARLAELLPTDIDRCDVLVNAQFATARGGALVESLDEWERVLRVNLTGPFAVVQALLPLLVRAPSASVINLGSIDGVMGNPDLASYSASKGGLLALTHVLARALGEHGIRVNYVARSGTSRSVDGVALDPERAAFEQRMGAATPLGRLGTPAETATVVRFLASADASFVTGAAIAVDGGRTAITPATF